MSWSEDLARWLEAEKSTPAALAKKIIVSTRTVQRWLSGQIVPDGIAQGRLEELGAPLPPATARPKPEVGKRLEARLERLEQKVDRLLALAEGGRRA